MNRCQRIKVKGRTFSIFGINLFLFIISNFKRSCFLECHFCLCSVSFYSLKIFTKSKGCEFPQFHTWTSRKDNGNVQSSASEPIHRWIACAMVYTELPSASLDRFNLPITVRIPCRILLNQQFSKTIFRVELLIDSIHHQVESNGNHRIIDVEEGQK